MDASQDRDTLSLCGDVQFRVSLVPRGVNQRKIQRILDARLPNAFVELWQSKGKNMQGRLSVPSSTVTACKELQCVLKSRNGRSIFIGPIKVHLRNEDLHHDERTEMRRKIAALEKKQLDMQTLLETMGSLLQQQQMVEDSDPFSSLEESGEPESKAPLVIQATGSCTLPPQGQSAPRPGKKRKKKKKSPPHKRMKVPEKEVDCVGHETSMQSFAREISSGISSGAIQRMDTHAATMMRLLHRCATGPPGT